MFKNQKVKVGAIASGICVLIGAAAGVKALATPALAATPPQSSTAIGGSSSVVGSGNASIVGSGNVVAGGSINSVDNGNGSPVTVYSGPVTNVLPKESVKSSGAVNPLIEQVHGRWNSNYSYPSSSGTTEVRGYTTFLQNGAYTFQGTQTIRTNAKGKDVVISWVVSDAGKWSAHDKLLTVQSTGMRSSVSSMTVDGTPVDIAMLTLLGMPQPRLEDSVAPGVATEFTVTSASKNELHLQALAPSGSKFAVIATRQANT